MAVKKRTTIDSSFVSCQSVHKNKSQDVRNSMTTRMIVKLSAVPKTKQPLSPGYGGSATFFSEKIIIRYYGLT